MVASQLRPFEPVEHEYRPLDIIKLLERDVDLVLTLVGNGINLSRAATDLPDA